MWLRSIVIFTTIYRVGACEGIITDGMDGNIIQWNRCSLVKIIVALLNNWSIVIVVVVNFMEILDMMNAAIVNSILTYI